MAPENPSAPSSLVDRLAARSQRLRVPMLVLLITLGAAVSAVLAWQTWRQEQRLGTLAFHDAAEDHLRSVARLLAGENGDESMARAVLASGSRNDLSVYLFDLAVPADPRRVYPPAGEAGFGTPGEVMASSRQQATQRVRVGTRDWLLLATPAEGEFDRGASATPWVVLGIGLVLTGLMGLILFGLIRSSDLMAALASARERANADLRERIAEREAAEAALARANDDLRRANQDLERFVGAVSHDLKSPLIAAEMLVTVLQQAVAKQDLIRAGETSAHIRKACTRMRRIIEDLLEHQRAGYADMRTTPVDLVEVALGVVEENRREWTERGVHVTIGEDLPTVRADRARLTSALDHLFVNAVRYGSRAGEPVEVEIGSTVTEEEVRLFVRDRGPGIAAEERERVFELFSRIAKDEEGTGIGLAIVRRVAEAHGGRAWVECPAGDGGGCAFYLALPRNRLVESPVMTKTIPSIV